MHVDDRLATVLAVSATGENLMRVQFRQLVDLIGTMPAEERGAGLDAAFLRLAELGQALPPADRAAALPRSGVRLRNPRLVAQLACGHPQVAAAAIEAASLTDEQWLDILPALPPAARNVLLRRPGIGTELASRLERLGAGDPALPQAGDDVAVPAAMTEQPAAVVLPLHGATPPREPRADVETHQPAARPDARVATLPPAREGIGAIVQRIEAFRRTREGTLHPANDAPQLPLAEPAAPPCVQAFGFSCDATGRISWAELGQPGMVVGLMLPVADRPPGDSARTPLSSGRRVAEAFSHRLPIRGALVMMDGAPAIAGEWLCDAAPEFDRGGRFIGYNGKLRRSPVSPAAEASNPEAVRVRQVLHELRTPVNAIQGFAEMIQQQLVGTVPHGYRAVAAGIAGDAAQMLAGFDELDRLARLDSAVVVLEPGESDLAAVTAGVVRQLDAYTGPRGSGFALAGADSPAPVAMARDDAERMIWRLLATLAGAARPGERLPLEFETGTGPDTALAVTLPEALAALPDPCEAGPPPGPQSLSGGLFGSGFALRLATAEARAAGGSLRFAGTRAVLSLPGAASRRLTPDTQLPNPDGVSASTVG